MQRESTRLDHAMEKRGSLPRVRFEAAALALAFPSQSFDAVLGQFGIIICRVLSQANKQAKVRGGFRTKEGRAAAVELLREREELGTLYRSVLTGEPITDGLTRGGGVLRRREIEFAIGPDDGIARRAAKGLGNIVGRVIRLPGGTIMAIDEVFKTIAYRQSMWEQTYGMADDLIRGGYEPNGALRALAAEHLENPEVHQRAIEFAKEQTLQQRRGHLTQAVESALGKAPYLRVIVPFVRTPANLFKHAASDVASPFTAAWHVGEDVVFDPARSIIAAGLKADADVVVKGGFEADRKLASAVIGSGSMLFAWSMFNEGNLVGEKAPPGVAPYSFRLPGSSE